MRVWNSAAMDGPRALAIYARLVGLAVAGLMMAWIGSAANGPRWAAAQESSGGAA